MKENFTDKDIEMMLRKSGSLDVRVPIKLPEKPRIPGVERIPESQKKHITKSGKK